MDLLQEQIFNYPDMPYRDDVIKVDKTSALNIIDFKKLLDAGIITDIQSYKMKIEEIGEQFTPLHSKFYWIIKKQWIKEKNPRAFTK